MSQTHNFTIAVSTLLSHFPLGNVRCMELMRRLAKRLKLKIYTTARSGYPEVPDLKRNVICALNVKYRRARRYAAIAFGPLLASIMSINGSDVHWLMGLSFPSLTYRMLGRKPIVLDIDDPDFSKPPHPLLFDDRVVKVVVPTNQIRDRMARLYRIGLKDIEVVPQGVDVNLF